MKFILFSISLLFFGNKLLGQEKFNNTILKFEDVRSMKDYFLEIEDFNNSIEGVWRVTDRTNLTLKTEDMDDFTIPMNFTYIYIIIKDKDDSEKFIVYTDTYKNYLVDDSKMKDNGVLGDNFYFQEDIFFRSTAISNKYNVVFRRNNKNEVINLKSEFNEIVSIENSGILNFQFKDSKLDINQKTNKKIISSYSQTFEMVKLFPTIGSVRKKSINKNTFTSGTCFKFDSDNHLVTNYHIVENAKSIRIKGLNGDFTGTVNAKILAFDIQNDLAIIEFNDSLMNKKLQIPYQLDFTFQDVGSNVYTLGYPLRSSMGDEIKLTNGLISSKSGFKGDITSYQISAPVQAGNSGSPLFNEKGNLIGVISAKHSNAENVSYAIKLSYLRNLIESIPLKLNPGKDITPLEKLNLVDQVKLRKNFIYIIEVEKQP